MRATELPPHALSEESIKAMSAELSALIAAREVVMATFIATGTQPHANENERAEGSHYELEPELIQVLARQNHPAAIDALADAVDSGRMAMDGVVCFGDARDCRTPRWRRCDKSRAS